MSKNFEQGRAAYILGEGGRLITEYISFGLQVDEPITGGTRTWHVTVL